MGLLPEREPKKNQYERPDEISSLTIERKEVVSPVPTKVKAQVSDDKGNKILTTPDDQKVDIIIPEVDRETLEVKIKGDTELPSVWSASYWLRIMKKAIYYGWKYMFDRKKWVG